MEKTVRCKTATIILGLSLLLQILYAIAEFIILILQRPLKNLLNAGASKVFKQNLFPIADIVWIIVMLVLHTGLFVLLWSQAENTSFKAAEIMSIVIGGMILAGSPVSLSILTNMGYAAQGAQMLANSSLLTNLMSMMRPLSRLGWVLLIVGATASLGNKRSCLLSR